MTSNYSTIKFVDQTPHVIRMYHGRVPKKNVVPGTSKLRLSTDGVSHRRRAEENAVARHRNESRAEFADGLSDLLYLMDYQLQDSADAEVPGNKDPASDEKKRLAVVTPSLDIKFDNYTPFGENNEFQLAMHYSQFMSSLFSVRDPRWNSYAYVGTSMVDKYTPLKMSVLAWSSLHLSMQNRKPVDAAFNYYDKAIRSVMQDGLNTKHGELVLVACYFLLQYDVMSGSNHAQVILREVWSGLQLSQIIKGDIPLNFGPYGCRVLVWLLSIDVKTALFHGNTVYPEFLRPCYSGPNVNLEYLRYSKTLEQLVVSNLYGRSRNLLRNVMGARYPSQFVQDDKFREDVLILMLKTTLMYGRLIRLRAWLDECGNSIEFDLGSLEKDMAALREEHRVLFFALPEETQSPVRYYIMLSDAMLRSMVIYYDRIRHPVVRTNPRCQKLASDIINIASRMDTVRAPGTPWAFEWPFPLFIAGIETTDIASQNWILAEFEQYSQEGWGENVTKISQLCAECIHRQNESGNRVDVGEVMEGTTGVFTM